MKVFNEETMRGIASKQFILVMDKKEAQTLIEIAESACSSNPKKKTWKNILSELENKLACF